eukprot:CAMPEP_0201714866 /NCGR_PEP_ID=MMETSP0593-20130828/1150_1 /ASSEMBLY_ACC=CAM_ASM_000672 /TAXON_ID=267983 /ORGANISM="Skeletonema japonicum, Strain CCMP2506" /LENGTH=506 /DNA_ID=CAMNT_0048204179 /DNA_START=186 /DNA_END=1706 /DNA_ORIENTATION=+
MSEIKTELNEAAAVAGIAAASTSTPPARKEGSQENSDGVGLGGTDDSAEGEEEEEVYPKVSKVKMTPRGGRHEPYEKKEENKPTSSTITKAAELATKRLYVGNLSWSVSWRELKDHMKSTGGEVTRADILQTPDGRSKGCGIVEFATAEEASEAIETLNDSELMGRQIFVREDREANKAADAVSKRVYVGNLAYGVAWQDLKDHMREAGEVQFAEVMMMQDGRSKGCGIVEFVDAEGAQNAIETLNDTELGGRQIFVREDREQNKVSGGGGGGMHGHHGGGWNRVGGGGGGRNNNQWGNVNVYVGNLSYETTWQELKDHMRRVGNIDKADILQGNDGRSKGCGIVIYQSPKEAQRAIRELQNSELNGRPIFVREDRESGSSSGGGGGFGNRGGAGRNDFGYRNNNHSNNNNFRTSANLMPGTPSEQGCQLYVGNLSWGTGWRDLKDYFAQCGDVDRAEVAEGPDGRKRGFGVIRFHSAGDAGEAIERLDGGEFMGRKLEVRLDNKV